MLFRSILLLLPVSLALLLGQGRWRLARAALALGLGALGLACLYWSGSKAGWLIAIALLGAWFLHLPVPGKLKLGLAGAAMMLGLAGFAVKYADYFDRGATSVGARFGYWRAAAQTAMEKPLLGTGPGTFQLAYKRHRAPGAEPWVVLAAGGNARDTADRARAFADIGARRMVATRLDAAGRMGCLLAAADHSRLAFSDVSFTPRVAKGLSTMRTTRTPTTNMTAISAILK